MNEWTDEQKEAIARIQRIAYLAGRCDATSDYAIWKNGAQYVGAMQRPLREIIKPMHDEIEAINRGSTADGGSDRDRD